MRISVLTPTRDRAGWLPGLCESLSRQGVPLEWIVVDDGSSDHTRDLVAGLNAPFPVTYVRQDAQGKHVAVNKAVELARGEFAAIVDSDDRLLDNALAELLAAWDRIPAQARSGYVGVTARSVTDAGLTGSPIPGGVLDASWQDAQYRHKIKGDLGGIQRLDVLRRHPFPPSSGFVVESQIWRAIGRTHRTRYIDFPFVWKDTSGADRLTRRPFHSIAPGLLDEHRTILNEDLLWCRHAPLTFVRSAVHYARAGLHSRTSPRDLAGALRHAPAKVLYAVALPVAVVLFARDRFRLRRAPGRHGG